MGNVDGDGESCGVAVVSGATGGGASGDATATIKAAAEAVALDVGEPLDVKESLGSGESDPAAAAA